MLPDSLEDPPGSDFADSGDNETAGKGEKYLEFAARRHH